MTILKCSSEYAPGPTGDAARDTLRECLEPGAPVKTCTALKRSFLKSKSHHLKVPGSSTTSYTYYYY